MFKDSDQLHLLINQNQTTFIQALLALLRQLINTIE